MAIDLKVPEKPVLKPIITVFGVGGAGGNAVNNMITANLQGANFVVANTDAQALDHSKCENQIQLGIAITKGLGAGASPEIGAMAAEESSEEIKGYLEGSNMVFITAGMGGGTGTGASHIVAKIAKELGILTVAVVTKPFHFEGKRRSRTAENGLIELAKHVDTLIAIPNQNLFAVTNELTSFVDAFKVADDVLRAGVQSVTDLMIMPGLINLDFADIKAIMSQMGKAMMGTGEASGENRAIQAAEAAIFNPLLDHSSMQGAQGVLINITGADMTLVEVDAAANRIREEVGNDTDANIIVGAIFNSDLKGIIRVSVIATGIDAEERQQQNVINNIPESVALKTDGIFTQDISEEEPPVFNNYNLEAEYSQNQEIENAESQNDFEQSLGSLASQAIQKNSLDNKKLSFLGKMWNSLKSNDQPSPVNKPPMINEQAIYTEKSLSNSLNHQSSDISEIPAFFRKPK